MCEWRRQQLGVSVVALAMHAKLTRPRLAEFLAGKRELRSASLDRLLPALGLLIAPLSGYRFPEVVEDYKAGAAPINQRGHDQQNAD